MTPDSPEGILLIDKPQGITSFGVIAALRRITQVQKIGHCGTLDPLATGLLVCLIGKKYTRLSDSLLSHDKAYVAEITLGSSTTTYDKEGSLVNTSSVIPSLKDIEAALLSFQGHTQQTPPQFSAKKVNGQKACDAARKGHAVALQPQTVFMHLELISYRYPLITLKLSCTKGTYVRSLAHDLGLKLTTFAHLSALRRIQSGSFLLTQAICLNELKQQPARIYQYLQTS